VCLCARKGAKLYVPTMCNVSTSLSNYYKGIVIFCVNVMSLGHRAMMGRTDVFAFLFVIANFMEEIFISSF
jgi:hypothetical protein